MCVCVCVCIPVIRLKNLCLHALVEYSLAQTKLPTKQGNDGKQLKYFSQTTSIKKHKKNVYISLPQEINPYESCLPPFLELTTPSYSLMVYFLLNSVMLPCLLGAWAKDTLT